MSKWLKRIDLILVFIITLITASGCFDSPSAPKKYGPVELVSAPSTTTVRFMNEGLYIGFLGAQRDFALIVDNAGYTMNKKTQNCGVATSEGTIGCASIMTNLLMNYGIKTSNYTGVSGSENLLLYYVTSSDFDSFGGPKEDGSWYDHLTGKNFDNPEYSEFEDSDIINSLSCGTRHAHNEVCKYSKEMSTQGYSKVAGNSMILLFENGSLYDIITDRVLDLSGDLNKGSPDPNLDNLIITNTPQQQELYARYYDSIVKSLKGKINVSNATNTMATSTGSDQPIRVIKSLTELENLVSGKSGKKDFLLFISSKGFIQEKIGTNEYYDVDKQIMTNANMTDGMDSSQKTAMLLFNSVSSFVDNCAYESEPMLNFLKELLRTLLAGGIGALGGAAVGAAAGALIGSFFPVIGTAVGAAVGAIVGAIAGFFAGIKINQELEKKLKSANGISDKSYCKIVESALTDISLNVPIYTYNIDPATDNIKKYENGTMTDTVLKNYYTNNRHKCVGQYRNVAVPSGLMSFFTDALDDKYAYADKCQKDLVSNIVGGFGGSPSLQLFLGNNKVDDLYGRLTTDLVNEMLSVWGLKSIGDLYTLGATSTEDKMNVSFASAQRIYNPVYCISNSSIPSCDGLQTYNVNLPSNESYLHTFDKEKAINMDFTDEYITYSRRETDNIFGIDGMRKLKLKLSNKSGKLTYYNNKIGPVPLWHGVEHLTGLTETPETEEILLKIKETILSNKNGGMYQIKYGDYYYVLCDTGEVIGYEVVGDSMNVVYYSEGEIGKDEYIFTDDANFSTMEDVENYYTYKVRGDVPEIDSGHEFYIYIKYDIKPGDSYKTAYYSYAI